MSCPKCDAAPKPKPGAEPACVNCYWVEAYKQMCASRNEWRLRALEAERSLVAEAAEATGDDAKLPKPVEDAIELLQQAWYDLGEDAIKAAAALADWARDAERRERSEQKS